MSSSALGGDQLVTRFLHNRRQIQPRLHYREFLPHHGEVSVAHISELDENAIWRLGQYTLGPSGSRSQLRGRADLDVAAVNAVGLRAIRDDAGFTRHAAIVDWPGDTPADYRVKLLAGRLAAAATLVVPGSSLKEPRAPADGPC